VSFENSAIIYVYRPFSLINSAGYPSVYISGHKPVALKNGGYIPFVVHPGEINILVKGEFLTWGLPKVNTSFNTEAGKEYFVRFSSSTSGFIIPVYVEKQLHLGLVEQGIGLSEIKETKQSK